MASGILTADTMCNIVNGLIAAGHDPSALMSGFHNAFIHGENLADTGYELDDDDVNLNKLFEGFEMSIKALNNMKNGRV